MGIVKWFSEQSKNDKIIIGLIFIPILYFAFGFLIAIFN